MNAVQKIGKIEAIGLFITIAANFVIFNVPSIVLQVSGSSAWLNIMYLGVVSFLLVLLLVKLFKNFPNNDIIDVAKYAGGKPLSIVTSILFITLFIFISALGLSYFCNGLKLIYFPLSPIAFILLFLLIPALVANCFGLRAIAGVNRIFIPIILLSLLIVFFSSFSDFTWERFFPILGYGFNTTFGYGITNLFAFTGLAYLYFLPPFLKQHNDFKFISILGTIFVFLFLFVSVVSLLLSFSAITNTDELFSIYLLTRMISFGKFLQRVDAIFIFLWILAFLSFLSLNFFLILQIFKRTCKIKNENAMIYALTAIMFGISLFWKDMTIIKFLFRSVFKYTYIFYVVIINMLILIIANIKKKREHI